MNGKEMITFKVKCLKTGKVSSYKSEMIQLLDEELPNLAAEGSPSGEVHAQHVRLWLCVGSLVTANPPLASRVAAAVETALENCALTQTRIVLQNVYARAVWASLRDEGAQAMTFAHATPLSSLLTKLAQPELRLTLATPLVAIAAQLLLHPDHGGASGAPGAAGADEAGAATYTGVQLDESDALRPLLAAVVGWSLSYAPKARFLAMLVLYHALERQLVATPGWYLAQLRLFLSESAAFQRLRERVKLDEWVSDAWRELGGQLRCLETELDKAQRAVSKELCNGPQDQWAGGLAPPAGEGDEGELSAMAPPSGGAYQRRDGTSVASAAAARRGAPRTTDVAVVGSLLDNVPNMAGLIRTTEALLGATAEVTLRTDKVLTDPHFLKMSVAAERNCAVVPIPEGPRLVAYLREKRAAGFTVLALEQTSTSIMLRRETTLPKRVVFVIGSEAHGVPAWLIQSGLIDGFLELRLLGCTKSLNAHIATAMLLWHYCLDHQEAA